VRAEIVTKFSCRFKVLALQVRFCWERNRRKELENRYSAEPQSDQSGNPHQPEKHLGPFGDV